MVRKSALVHPWREPVAPKPAATILLLRDAPGGLEVLMTRRSSTASFAPGAFVFPGGALDEADRAAAGTRSVRARADQDLEQQSFAAAALREAYEELGVLLAYRQDHAQLCEGSELPHLARHGDDDFYQRLDAAGLQLAVDRAFWLSHWITDRDLPKRFDARFFVAQMPPGYAPVADDGETFEPTWVVPAEGLQRHERGEFNIIYPTIRTLRQLCRYRSVRIVG
jgi:recombination protein RecT